jgi:hypothetical protein
MRRRRPLLQVSTFPFLAVLLCAMGSLILILLVIDRRAKLLAHAKALEKVARADAEREAAAAAARAEWEQRRRDLHARLAQEEEQVIAEVASARREVDAATSRAKQGRLSEQQLGERLRGEQAQLERQEREVAVQRKAAAQAQRQTSDDNAELGRLSRELETLERTLADLKAARERAQKTHSLVPYHGKRGDNRQPIYLECAATSLIFHPDRFALDGTSAHVSDLRAEITRRFSQQRTTEKQPYLLFLVRPNGILTYHQTLAALQGVAFDYGYECVDQDWVFDFPDSHDAPGGQPAQVAAKKEEESAPQSAVRPRAQGLKPSEVPSEPGTGGVSGARVSGASGLAFGPGPPMLGLGLLTRPLGPTTGLLSVPGGSLRSADVARSGHPAPTPSGLGDRASVGGFPAGEGLKGHTGGAAATEASGTPSPGSAVAGQGSPPARGPTSLRTLSPNPLNPPSGAPTADATGSQTGDAQRSMVGPVVAAAPLGGMSPSGFAVGTSQPSTAQSGPAKPPGTAGGPQEQAPGPGAQGPVLSTPFARTPEPAPRLPRLTGGRDWIIPIECSAKAVVLYPLKLQFPTDKLSQEGDRLRQQVQQMISRRQASVRPGEPPYRPQIRLLVRPDASGTYYRAYPLLESLGVIMTRQNIDPNEEIRPANFNN